MRYFIGHTNAATRKPWEDFVNVLYGIDPCEQEDRWKTCIREVDNTLGFLAGEFYVRENFNEYAKERGTHLVENISAAFIEIFAELDWIDPETKEAAVRKVKNRVKVGYNDASPNMTDPVDLARYRPFGGFVLNGSDTTKKLKAVRTGNLIIT